MKVQKVDEVLKSRQTSYGGYKDNIQACAAIMKLLEIPADRYLEAHILDIYVTKLVRIAVSPWHLDSHLDIIGYTKLNKDITYTQLPGLNIRIHPILEILEHLYIKAHSKYWDIKQLQMMSEYTYLLLGICRIDTEFDNMYTRATHIYAQAQLGVYDGH